MGLLPAVMAMLLGAGALLAAEPAAAHECYGLTPSHCGPCADDGHYHWHYGPGHVTWCSNALPPEAPPPEPVRGDASWVLLRERL